MSTPPPPPFPPERASNSEDFVEGNDKDERTNGRGRHSTASLSISVPIYIIVFFSALPSTVVLRLQSITPGATKRKVNVEFTKQKKYGSQQVTQSYSIRSTHTTTSSRYFDQNRRELARVQWRKCGRGISTGALIK